MSSNSQLWEGVGKMACGLTVEELFILNVLYQHRCVNSSRSKNLGEIARAFRSKFDQNPEDVARGLASKAYLGQIRKKDIKYYISSMEKACYALNCHGYNATPGRILPGRVRRL